MHTFTRRKNKKKEIKITLKEYSYKLSLEWLWGSVKNKYNDKSSLNWRKKHLGNSVLGISCSRSSHHLFPFGTLYYIKKRFVYFMTNNELSQKNRFQFAPIAALWLYNIQCETRFLKILSVAHIMEAHFYVRWLLYDKNKMLHNWSKYLLDVNWF